MKEFNDLNDDTLLEIFKQLPTFSLNSPLCTTSKKVKDFCNKYKHHIAHHHLTQYFTKIPESLKNKQYAIWKDLEGETFNSPEEIMMAIDYISTFHPSPNWIELFKMNQTQYYYAIICKSFNSTSYINFREFSSSKIAQHASIVTVYIDGISSKKPEPEDMKILHDYFPSTVKYGLVGIRDLELFHPLSLIQTLNRNLDIEDVIQESTIIKLGDIPCMIFYI